MRIRIAIITILLALCCYAIVVVMMRQSNPRTMRVQTDVELVPVVVATEDLGRFTTLTHDLVSVHMTANDAVQPFAFTNAEDVLGRMLVQPVVKGEAIVETKLAAKGPGRGIDTAIPEGMQVLTLTLPDVPDWPNVRRPRDRVDVLRTNPGGETSIVLENVELLTEPQQNDLMKKPQVVTLLLTSEQVDKLNQAKRKGKISISLHR
jgi:pilus assembly protein CpaB